eukprot:1160592-Pelagomonas_calceolata.AAC.2
MHSSLCPVRLPLLVRCRPGLHCALITILRPCHSPRCTHHYALCAYHCWCAADQAFIVHSSLHYALALDALITMLCALTTAGAPQTRPSWDLRTPLQCPHAHPPLLLLPLLLRGCLVAVPG